MGGGGGGGVGNDDQTQHNSKPFTNLLTTLKTGSKLFGTYLKEKT